MRNSPFQLKSGSLLQTMEQNLNYKNHQKQLRKLKQRDSSPRDYLNSLRAKNDSL